MLNQQGIYAKYFSFIDVIKIHNERVIYKIQLIGFIFHLVRVTPVLHVIERKEFSPPSVHVFFIVLVC